MDFGTDQMPERESGFWICPRYRKRWSTSHHVFDDVATPESKAQTHCPCDPAKSASSL